MKTVKYKNILTISGLCKEGIRNQKLTVLLNSVQQIPIRNVQTILNSVLVRLS